MKPLYAFLFGGILLGTGSAVCAQVAAGAQDASLNASTPKVIPVLVSVNRAGKITAVSSSTRLQPRFNRLLRENLDEMISRPAMDHGKPMSSQFVMNVALEVTPRTEGDYSARFVYVSACPVPTGSWYWNHIDGHRLALENRNNRWERRSFDRPPHQWEPAPRANYQRMHTPPARTPRPSTPTAAQSGGGKRN